MGNEISNVGCFEKLPLEILRETLFPMLVKEYAQLHLVCKTADGLLTKWAHVLPKKKIGQYWKLVFSDLGQCSLVYDDVDDEDGCAEPDKLCLNPFADPTDTAPSLVVLIRHIDLRSMFGIEFIRGYPITKFLLRFLIDKGLVSIKRVEFCSVDMSRITEAVLKSFLDAVGDSGVCQQLFIRSVSGPRNPNKIAISDKSLECIMSSPVLENIDFCNADEYDLFSRVTDATLANFATNFPRSFDLFNPDSQGFTADGIVQFIQSWLACQTYSNGSLVVSGKKYLAEIALRLSPDQIAHGCYSFVYVRPPNHPFRDQRLKIRWNILTDMCHCCYNI